ncbi:MAG: DUF3575 domain-containing protein [Bacteroidota bacterium]
MKKQLWITGIVALLWICPFGTQAQRKPVSRKPNRLAEVEIPKNVIKINPLSLFALTTSVSYERVINEQMSGQLGLFYTFPVIKIAHTKFQGFGLTPEFRYYFVALDKAPKGFYVAPFVRYQRFTLTYDDPESNQYDGTAVFRAMGAGANVGGQWIFGESFTLNAFVGLVANGYTLKTDVPGLSDKIRIPITGSVSPRFGISMGMAF